MSDEHEKIASFQQPPGNATPRELLLRALQDCDDLDGLIIIGRKKGTTKFASGMANISSFDAISTMEVFKARLLGQLERVPVRE